MRTYLFVAGMEFENRRRKSNAVDIPIYLAGFPQPNLYADINSAILHKYRQSSSYNSSFSNSVTKKSDL